MAKGKTVGSDVLGAPGAKVISADGTGNLSKQRRDDLVKKLGAIRSFLEKSAAVVIIVGVAIANWRKRGKARGGGAREALALRAGAVSA